MTTLGGSTAAAAVVGLRVACDVRTLTAARMTRNAMSFMSRVLPPNAGCIRELLLADPAVYRGHLSSSGPFGRGFYVNSAARPLRGHAGWGAAEDRLALDRDAVPVRLRGHLRVLRARPHRGDPGWADLGDGDHADVPVRGLGLHRDRERDGLLDAGAAPGRQPLGQRRARGPLHRLDRRVGVRRGRVLRVPEHHRARDARADRSVRVDLAATRRLGGLAADWTVAPS